MDEQERLRRMNEALKELERKRLAREAAKRAEQDNQKRRKG